MGTICKVYAFRNRKEVLNQSSSGGAFTAIYEVMFKNLNGVIVYGVAFDSELKVTHQKVEKIEECVKFRGSKYVQSNMKDILIDITEKLKKGKVVLFTGTPCQIYSVKHFCETRGINMEKLYLVDIICHGTGMPTVWERYKHWLEEKHKSKLIDFQFRYKGTRWKSYPVMARFANGKRLINTHDSRLYTQLFFTALSLNNACYNCKFANLDRHSDLTIGDFWGISKVMPSFPKGNGTSEILVSTEKGQKLIEWIKELPDILIRECNSDAYIKYQHNLNGPTEKPLLAEQFRKDLLEKDFKDVLRIYAGNNIKGKIIHGIKKICGEMKITELMKRVLRR